MSSDWASSLFCPCDDLGECCTSACCPCLEYGSIRQAMGSGYWEGCCLFCACNLCSCIWHTETRHAIRTQYGIDGSQCMDCLAVTFCGCCALSQEAILLKSKGKMPSHTSGGAPKRQKMQRLYDAAE